MASSFFCDPPLLSIFDAQAGLGYVPVVVQAAQIHEMWFPHLYQTHHKSDGIIPDNLYVRQQREL